MGALCVCHCCCVLCLATFRLSARLVFSVCSCVRCARSCVVSTTTPFGEDGGTEGGLWLLFFFSMFAVPSFGVCVCFFSRDAAFVFVSFMLCVRLPVCVWCALFQALLSCFSLSCFRVHVFFCHACFLYIASPWFSRPFFFFNLLRLAYHMLDTPCARGQCTHNQPSPL